MSKIEFPKAKAHIRYRLADGTIVPGVTTIIGVLAKPALIYWANKMGLQGIDTRKYVDAAANVGTLAHYMVECELRGIEPDLADYTPNEVDKASNAVIKFLEYRKEHDLQPTLLEEPLVSEDGRFGGTIDFVGYRDGDPYTLIDFKTSKALYPEHLLQVAAYWHLCLVNSYEINSVYILRIGRDEGEGFEERKVDNLNKRFELFAHCLEVYRLKKELGG